MPSRARSMAIAYAWMLRVSWRSVPACCPSTAARASGARDGASSARRLQGTDAKAGGRAEDVQRLDDARLRSGGHPAPGCGAQLHVFCRGGGFSSGGQIFRPPT